MRVVAPEIFEMRVPRDLLPFILPQLTPDDIDNMDTVNTDIFPSASPGDSSELFDPLVETQGGILIPLMLTLLTPKRKFMLQRPC